MTAGSRLIIGVMAVVILAGLAAAFALEWTGRAGAAIFVGIATSALGVLCPSPLHQAERQDLSQDAAIPEARPTQIQATAVVRSVEPGRTKPSMEEGRRVDAVDGP